MVKATSSFFDSWEPLGDPCPVCSLSHQKFFGKVNASGHTNSLSKYLDCVVFAVTLRVTMASFADAPPGDAARGAKIFKTK